VSEINILDEVADDAALSFDTRGLIDNLERLLRPWWSIAIGFVVTHAWIVWRAFHYRPEIFGDVTLYEWWARIGFDHGRWPVLDFDWVYPAGALLPITLPALGNDTQDAYQARWVVMLCVLSALALWRLVVASERGWLAAWWYLAFLAVLGPIWMGRLEGVIAPIALIALVEARRRPALAVAIATFGAWIKIAPGAVVLALAASASWLRDFCQSKSTADRERSLGALTMRVLFPGVAVSVAVVGLAVLGGAGGRALSVFGEQQGRSLQAESVAATSFSLARLGESPGFEFNTEIFTFEVPGGVAGAVASALDTVLILAVLGLGVMIFLAARRRPDLTMDVFLLGAYAITLALIVFNKVGSPQFIAWIGPTVAAGIALASPTARRLWHVPAAGLLGIALLTHLIYPIAYGEFIGGEARMIWVAAVRNILLVALLGIAVWRLEQITVNAHNANKNH